MRMLIRSSEMLAQIIMLTSLYGFTFWSIYMASEAFRESPWLFVAVTFFILLGFAFLIYQGLELIARITYLLYPRTHHIDELEVQSLTPHTAEMLDRVAEMLDRIALREGASPGRVCAVLLDQGIKLIDLPEGVSPVRVGTVIANEEVDDWGSLHEIVEEYHNDVRFGGDGQ